MEILIAGKGFIGSAVGERLEEEHEVKYLGRREADYEYDITESFSIDESFDLLIHTIGLAPGFSSASDYREVHVEGTRNLVEAVESDRILYMSALHAGQVDHSFYRTKKEAEEVIESSDMEHVIIRPSAVYGPGNELTDMMRKMAFTRVFLDVKTETQPIIIEDLVEMVTEIIEKEETGIFRAAGPEKMTFGELGSRVYAEEGYGCVLVPTPQFLLELMVRGLGSLLPSVEKENVEILRNDNTTDRNDAEELLELDSID